MKRKERELPGGLHCVVLNFQNQHFWLIRDHMCFKKKGGGEEEAVECKLTSSKTPKIKNKAVENKT